MDAPNYHFPEVVVVAEAPEQVTPAEVAKATLSGMSYERMQLLRYTLAGAKGGDGDPPYARDMSLMGAPKKPTAGTFDADGTFRYAREGD